MEIKTKQLTLNNKNITIRSSRVEDSKSICRHRKITSGETHFMSRYLEECKEDIEGMKLMIKETLEHPQNFSITVFENDVVIGDLSLAVTRDLIKFRHKAYLGMSIQKDYCNLGLGSLMLEMAIKQAKENGFEQIEVDVFGDNHRAIHLYEKHGFETCGRLPKAFKLKDGRYIDEIMMIKML